MALEVKVLDTGDVELDSSFLVLGREPGRTYRVPTYAYLILGGEAPVLVDSGFRNTEIMARLGMRGIQTREMRMENQLAKFGLKFADVKYLLHTHLHIDHAGQDDRFPMTTTVVINRRELEYSVSGLMHPQYPKEDIQHLVERLHTKGALQLLDLELSGGDEIMPGIVCVASGAHTEGHMSVMVDTADGVACICGDVIYDIQDQIVDPVLPLLADEIWPTGNHGTTKRQERAAIRKILNSARAVFPCHDRGGLVEKGRVIGRLIDSWPGPATQLTRQRRAWMAA